MVQAYCMHCRKNVDMVNPTKHAPTSRHVVITTGTCPVCGGKISTTRKW
jgi:C4-type Zn-finger protein